MNFYQSLQFPVKLCFKYSGKRYRGRGMLRWDPQAGFSLDAALESNKKTTIKSIGGIEILTPAPMIMRPRTLGGIAVAPTVFFGGSNDLDISWFQWLSTKFDSVVFSQPIRNQRTEDNWQGFALYRTGVLQLPDRVDSEERIHDKVISSQWSISAIVSEDARGRKVIGHMINEEDLHLFTSTARIGLSFKQHWDWFDAFRQSLTLLSGKSIQMLSRTADRWSRQRTEFRAPDELEELGYLSLFNTHQPIDASHLLRLTNFFIDEPQLRWLCWNVYRQLRAAARQRYTHARELLVATILEAMLRGILQIPFEEKKGRSKRWNVGVGLNEFIRDVLAPRTSGLDSEKQSALHGEVMRAQSWLRDRNAHPDWHFKRQGEVPRPDRFKSINHMRYLSRFYGFMILAIAGIDFHLSFPSPYVDRQGPWQRFGK